MRIVVLIILGLAALGFAMYLSMTSEEDNEEPTAPAVEQSQPAPTPAPETTTTVAPSFDVVRINPDGDAVIAGRATPGSTVAILDGEALLGSIKADDRGEWVFLPSKPLEPGDRELNLRASNPDGSVTSAEDVVVLVVPEQKSETLAFSVSKDGTGAVKALQTPGAEALTLSIDAVNYDESGKLSLSGRAPEGGVVFLYLDNDFLGNTVADERGSWSLSPLKIIVPGVYTLRADHVDENQKVLNRVTIPFARSENVTDIPKDRQFVVQPGNSLWRIARNLYGSGFDYVVIYQANKDQIGDPDLIYPGQVFELPEGR